MSPHLSMLSLGAIFFACFLIFPTPAASQQHNNLTDLSALLAIKFQITADPQNVLSGSWNTTTSFCIWSGVTCSNRRQRVTALNIANVSLAGTISPHIGNLSFLVSLDLSYNKLSGGLPDTLGRLRRLKYLYLNDNWLSGDLPANVFGNLPSLVEIRLRYNNLTGRLPEELGRLPNLRLLNLRKNELTGNIPEAFFNSSSLEELSFGENMLDGPIPGVVQLPRLQYLSLDNNQLDGQIPSSLGRCRSLLSLSLSYNNQLTGSIPKELGDLNELQNLYLDNLNLTGTIPPSIGNLTQLQTLELSFNRLAGAVPSSLFNMSSLQSLLLVNNSLSGELPKDAGLWLPKIQQLYLDINHFTGEIPQSLSNASMLTELDLSNNNFTGIVPASLGDLEKLQKLTLNVNQLRGDLGFLTPLTKCRELIQLYFNDNFFQGVLPDVVGNLSTKLEKFSCEGNQIDGRIPPAFSNLSSLIDLALSSNQLTGTIPPAVTAKEGLQRLYLYSNQLEGPIPNELGGNLGLLYLHGNRLSGPIPESIGNLSGLGELYLAENNLTSNLPSRMWSLAQLTNLNLSHNHVSGSLPADVSQLKKLTQMDLSANQFSGEIPSTLGDMEMVSTLILAQNSFSGPLPPTLKNLRNLDSLDLSSNAISGEIPKSLTELPNLSYLNLSFNRLEGEIPEGKPFANLTATSFMGNLELCGAPRFNVPPCAVGGASSRSRSRNRVLKYVVPAIAALVVLVALASAVYIERKKKKNKVPSPQDSLEKEGHRLISHQELVEATDGFSEANLLGAGSFGKVYKGKLKDGTLSAIKVLNWEVGKAWKSFDTECQVMRAVRHRNLVKIISSCSNPEFRALILQFMPNGSLENWLYSDNYYLSLLQRINIMMDVALALEYLHHDCSTPVVHCDLKPSNVLLDEGMVAHVADFGIAKQLVEISMTTTATPGTFGYMAPEYGMTGRVSTKGDVYSYGILLLETFTRKKPTDATFTGESSLRQSVAAAFPHSIMEVVDGNLQRDPESGSNTSLAKDGDVDAVYHRCLSSVIELGLTCSSESPKERPTMKDVAVTVNKIKMLLSSSGEGPSQ